MQEVFSVISPLQMLVAFLGGMLPAFVWLAFWLLEDRCEPEPKRLIFFTFLAGMASTVVALILEASVKSVLASPGETTVAIYAAPVIEELVKFGAAYIVALRVSAFDEPLDAVVYMATAALGFSALENALFLVSPVVQQTAAQSIVIGDLRFMGASLLHLLTSTTVGLALAFAFYKSAAIRRLAVIGGLILAISLHTVFNFFILQEAGAILWMFLGVWVGIIVVLLLTERIKVPLRDYC